MRTCVLVCWCLCGYLNSVHDACVCVGVLVSVWLPEVRNARVCVLVSVWLPEVHNARVCVGVCVVT